MDRGRREVLLTESVLGDLTPPSGDPEVEYLKGTYQAQTVYVRPSPAAACRSPPAVWSNTSSSVPGPVPAASPA